MHGYGQDGVSSFLVFQSQGQYSSLWDCREWKKERSISITIVEDKYSVDESGRLIISVEAIHEMGLDIGDDVFVSFISNGQEANVYRELLIASASLQELDSAPKSITIPDELMENAGIMPDADIQIICGQGVILITAQASMSTSELREVLQSLYTANNVMEQLAGAPKPLSPILYLRRPSDPLCRLCFAILFFCR